MNEGETMSWGKFEWLKELKEQPKHAEVNQHLREEVSFENGKVRNKGFLMTEARTE